MPAYHAHAIIALLAGTILCLAAAAVGPIVLIAAAIWLPMIAACIAVSHYLDRRAHANQR